MTRRNQSVTVMQATEESPTLARLAALATDSGARLKAIEPLIPAALRARVKPGPIDGTQWCLILENNAVAAKIRQLLPSLEAHLRTEGWEVTAIRLKVQTSHNS